MGNFPPSSNFFFYLAKLLPNDGAGPFRFQCCKCLTHLYEAKDPLTQLSSTTLGGYMV